MEIGFFFWPYDVALVEAMADAADRFGYDLIGVADTPGNAMDPWVAATLVASRVRRARVALCVTNLVTRHPAVTAASIASLNLLAPGRTVLGIGVGHSGTRNLGAPRLAASELADGVTFVKTLLRGEPAAYRGAPAHLPWVKSPSPVFLAASHPRSLRAAGAVADGAFVNFGLAAENVSESEATVVDAARAAGRDPADVEIWQIACLDCHEDGEAARRKIGAILAFVSAYIMGGGDLARRGVPERYRAPLQELRAPATPTPRWWPSWDSSITSRAASRSAARPANASPRCAPPRPPACGVSCSP
jgi:5,10-methylenetetrahydromethanopterin reductase